MHSEQALHVVIMAGAGKTCTNLACMAQPGNGPCSSERSLHQLHAGSFQPDLPAIKGATRSTTADCRGAGMVTGLHLAAVERDWSLNHKLSTPVRSFCCCVSQSPRQQHPQLHGGANGSCSPSTVSCHVKPKEGSEARAVAAPDASASASAAAQGHVPGVVNRSSRTASKPSKRKLQSSSSSATAAAVPATGQCAAAAKPDGVNCPGRGRQHRYSGTALALKAEVMT